MLRCPRLCSSGFQISMRNLGEWKTAVLIIIFPNQRTWTRCSSLTFRRDAVLLDYSGANQTWLSMAVEWDGIEVRESNVTGVKRANHRACTSQSCPIHRIFFIPKRILSNTLLLPGWHLTLIEKKNDLEQITQITRGRIYLKLVGTNLRRHWLKSVFYTSDQMSNPGFQHLLIFDTALFWSSPLTFLFPHSLTICQHVSARYLVSWRVVTNCLTSPCCKPMPQLCQKHSRSREWRQREDANRAGTN